MLTLVDEIIRSKRRTMAIIIQRDGKVIVRAPLKTPEKTIRAFVESKSGWINEKKAQALPPALLTVRQFKAGEKFPLLGQEHALSLVENQEAALKFEAGFFLKQKYLPQALIVFEQWYRVAALKILTGRVVELAQKFGLRYQKIRITAARTRWGSCSSRGTLSFTWRLVMAPLEVVDYVVIHELAHLKVQNHSARFWAEVERMLPDYKLQREWLKKNGHTLSLDGAA